MIENKGTLAQQMKRCYLLGYIVDKHNCFKIVRQNKEFTSYKHYRKNGAIEKLQQYGINKKVGKICVVVAFYFELLISLSFLIIMFLNYSVRCIWTRKQIFEHCKISPKLISTEKRFVTMYTRAGFDPETLTIIDIPQQVFPYKNLKTVSVFSGISYSQLLKSFWNAITLSIHMNRKYKKDDYLLRSYSSFPFFLFFFFVNNLDNSNELVFFNHYDRWTYLFGNSRLKKTYIQHGKLWKDNIQRINCGYAVYLCKSQQETLEYTLFNNKPKASYMKPMELCGFEKLKNNGYKDVLVVCLESFAQKHEFVVSKLYNSKVNLYLKPHPSDNLSAYTRLTEQYPEIVLLGKAEYPRVDYVISYDSTLADEYEMHDIPVLKYDDEDFMEKLEALIS
jgi:hypothetical protein